MSLNKILLELAFLASGMGVVFFVLIPTDYHVEPIYSYIYGKTYVVRIANELIAKSPLWAHDVAEPPLSKQRAIELADQVYQSFIHVKVDDTQHRHWELAGAFERQAGTYKWFWCVTYWRLPPYLGGYPDEELTIVVLMDGTVLKPILWVKRQKQQ
ncbi:MAG: hypothetical protein QM703_03590 [Gemmatales bacterium]